MSAWASTIGLLSAWLFSMGCGTKVLVPEIEGAITADAHDVGTEDAVPEAPVPDAPAPPLELLPCPVGIDPMAGQCVHCSIVEISAVGPSITCLLCDPIPMPPGGTCRSCRWSGLLTAPTCQLCDADASAMSGACDESLAVARVGL